jgi:uncharacterized protein YkwD/acetyltransferase-like isoleucine patch superfamily enzyme
MKHKFRWLLFALIFLSQVPAYAEAPTFAFDYPNVDEAEIKHSSLKLQVKTNQNGKAYYVVLTGGSTEPSADQIKAGTDDEDNLIDPHKKGVLNLTANTEASSYIIGLEQPPAAYDIYVVAEDSAETLNFPEIVEVDLEEVPDDTTAPVFESNVNVTQTAVDLRVNSNETGNAHYVILDNGATEPTKAQIKNGQDNANNDVADDKKGTLSLTANTEANDSITGLAASTPYDVFIIAEDAEGNVATIQKIDVLTLISADAPIFNKKETGNITTNSFDLTLQTDKDSTAYYTVLDDNAIQPSEAQLKAANANISLTENTDNTTTITGLTDNTNYDVFVMAEANGNVSTIYKLDVLTLPDTTPPIFETNYPKVENITDTTAYVKVKTNENGKAYYVVLADNDPVPTDVKTHDNKFNLTANRESSYRINSLNQGTAYDIYIIAEDAAGNVTTATTFPIEFTTRTAIAGEINNENNTIDDVIIKYNAIITGGRINNNVTIEANATLRNVEFLGAASISNVRLGRNIIANTDTVIRNVRLEAATTITGGTLAGTIRGDASAPATLNNLQIANSARLSDVIIGDGVTFGENVTLTNVQFTGQNISIYNVTLEGIIKLNSSTVITNATLGYQATVTTATVNGAGTLAGTIRGYSWGPALLRDAKIADHSILSNVIISSDVTFGANVTLNNVEFSGAVSISNVTLEGTIRASSSTVISNVILGANVRIIGGTLAGIIRADSTAPAILQNLQIADNSTLSNANIDSSVIVGSNVTQINVNFIYEDNVAPIFASSYPKLDNITQTTATLKVKINENGKAYYVVLDDNATAPTDVKTNGNQINLNADQEASSNINGLNAESAYDIYVIAEDAAGNVATTNKLDLLTLAAPDNGGSDSGDSGDSGDSEPTAFADTLATHNKWRNMVGVANLTWSDKAATAAQNWANTIASQCQLQHGGLSDADGTQYGQNIHWTSASSTTMEQVVNAWASEKQFYNYSDNSCEAGKVCGHYTQIVWANTTQVGCGQAQCSNGSTMTVCNYTPPGNYIGQKPYIPQDNVAPAISGKPAIVAKVGYSYKFIPKASDDNGDSLIFSITNKPNWATFSTSTGTLTGTPNAEANHTGIEISVSDGQLSSQLPSFNIEVQSANRSPTISGNPRTQIDVGKYYEFTPIASDPDGDSLTFEIQNKPDWAQFDTVTGRLSGQPSDSQTGTSLDIKISVTDGKGGESFLRMFSITVNSASALFKPSNLVVTAAAGGVNPASQKLRVNYPNGYNRNNLWNYATVNASFANITSALTSSLWIEWNISFNTKRLSIGEHTGSITIKTDNGDKTVPIIVNILDTAELQLSRSKLNFGAVEGGKVPKKQKIKVSSSGSKILSWSTATNADWLTIEPSQGTTTQNVEIGISQLANAGEHSATISFIDSENGNTIDVPVTLNVVAANSEEVQLTALEVVQVVQNLNNSIPLIAEKPTFVRAHVSSTIGSSVSNVNAKLTGKNGDTVVFEISPSNAGASINVSDNPNRSKFNDSFLFELPKEYSTGNLTLEFAGVDKPFACADTGNDCKETVNFATMPAIDMKLVDIVWLRKLIAPTQKMRQAIPNNIYNIYPISTLNVTQSNVPLILNSRTSLNLLRTTIRNLFLMKYFDGPTAEKQYYYGVGGKFYGTVGISLRPGTLGAGAYIEGIDRRVFGHNLELGYRSDRPCGNSVEDSSFSNSISPVETGPNAVYGLNAKTKRIYRPTTSDFMTKRKRSWISEYNYKCAIETLKSSTRSTRSSRSIRSLVNTVTINGRITGTSSGVIDNLVNAVTTGSVDEPTAGDYKMSLQTRDGSTELAAYPFGPVNINVGGDSDASTGSSESAYSLILPRPDNMKRIVLYDKNGTKLDERIASENAPTVTVTYPNGGENIQNDAEKLTISWNANDADGDTLTYAIDYSLDAGTSWKPLVSGYDQKSIEIDIALLAGTKQGKFRVIADDSFNSGSDESDATFTIEGKNPEVSITSPNNGDLFISGQTIYFVGQAYDKEDGKITGTWSSDRDGDLGTGESLSLLAEDLAEGTHTITLTATDSDGQKGSSTISINVYRERPTSLPATFSVSEDSFTIDGYFNSGTATADLTISNGGDGNLTWSADSDTNWLTFSQTTGTAASNIKLIANPAGLDIGVYSGNVILTSDVPGVIAKTIEVTFKVDEAFSISVPVQQQPEDNSVDNTDTELSGIIENTETLKDITLAANTEIQGGRLQGNIVGSPNGFAQLDNLEIVANSILSNVTLGKNITFGAGVTLKNVKLMGASLFDVILEGTIRTASSATVITNPTFRANAEIIGGKLAGIIKGDSKDRAVLKHLLIDANSEVTDVIISDGVEILNEVKLGKGVQFSKVENIPFNIDLTQTLPSFTDSIAVDLSADLVQGGKGLLVTINDLPAFTDFQINQTDKTGNLQLKVEDLVFAVTPVKVKRVDSKDQSLRLGIGNSVYFTTDDGIEVEAHPAVQDLTMLGAMLAAIELPVTISKEGNIQIPINDKLWISGRAELASKLAEEADEVGFKLKGDLVVLVFEKDGQKREQVLYPAPASNAFTEEASLTEEGILSFGSYKGKLDYYVENGEATESYGITEIADSNGDFLITYPQGYKQKLFALPATE